MSMIAVIALLVLGAFIWFGYLRRKVTGRRDGDASTGSDGDTTHSTDSSCDSGSSGGCDSGGSDGGGGGD